MGKHGNGTSARKLRQDLTIKKILFSTFTPVFQLFLFLTTLKLPFLFHLYPYHFISITQLSKYSISHFPPFPSFPHFYQLPNMPLASTEAEAAGQDLDSSIMLLTTKSRNNVIMYQLSICGGLLLTII